MFCRPSFRWTFRDGAHEALVGSHGHFHEHEGAQYSPSAVHPRAGDPGLQRWCCDHQSCCSPLAQTPCEEAGCSGDSWRVGHDLSSLLATSLPSPWVSLRRLAPLPTSSSPLILPFFSCLPLSSDLLPLQSPLLLPNNKDKLPCAVSSIPCCFCPQVACHLVTPAVVCPVIIFRLPVFINLLPLPPLQD